MLPIDCPLCDSPDWTGVATMQDRLLGVDGRFHMVRCSRCGLHYLNPQPTMEELVPYYSDDYDPFQIVSPDQLSSLQRYSLNYGLYKRCRLVNRQKTGGHLLEIGCATGLFLDAMWRTGSWQVQGVDVSAKAVECARETFGLDVFHGSVTEAHLSDDEFDAVVMWDVLEHVHSPRETLLEIRRILKPDGVLIFRVPLLDAWDRRLFGRYWAGWDAPRHLTLFSEHTLDLMLARTGFCVQRTACISGSYPTFVLSVRFWAREFLSPGAQRLLRRSLEALPTRLVTAPFFRLVDQLKKSTVTTVIARPGTRCPGPLVMGEE
jgi:SAM-dependent methyltransferase